MTFDNCQDERGTAKEFKGDFNFNGKLIAHDYNFEMDEADSEQKTTFIHLYETEFDLFVLVIRDLYDYQIYLCDDHSEIRRIVSETVPYYRKNNVETFFANVKEIFDDKVGNADKEYIKQKTDAYFNRRNHLP